jgi:hypothetical protein
VARFGGEEFVVICEETDARGAMLLAERVREELGRTTFHAAGASGAAQIEVTCSVGVATYPEVGGTWEELFKAADEALYVSKRSGRNRSTAWSPSMRAAAAQAGTSEPAAPAKPAPRGDSASRPPGRAEADGASRPPGRAEADGAVRSPSRAEADGASRPPPNPEGPAPRKPAGGTPSAPGQGGAPTGKRAGKQPAKTAA